MMTQKVSKSSIKVSLLWLRRLAALFVLFFAAQMGWGQTYYWVGGGADNDWNTLGNWNTQADGNGDTPVNLTTSDSIIIPSGAPVISNYSTNQVSSITIQSGAKLYITCSVNFSSTTFVNNGNVYFYNQTGGSEIEFKTPAGCNTLGNFNFWGETTITINGDCTADTFNMMADSDSHYVTDNFDATIAKGTGNGKLTVTNGMEFSRASSTDGKTGSIIFSADVDAGSIVTHSGVIFTLYNGYTINTATYEHNAGNGDVVARTIIFGVFNATTSFDMAVSTYANAGSTEVSVGPTGQLNSPLIKTTKRTYSNTSSTEPFSNEGTINTKVFDIPYEIINTGTITADADGTSASITAGSFTDNGAGTGTINLKNGTTSLTVTDDSTQNAIVLEETDSTIEGNYTLTSFTADDTTTMQGKTVTLNNSEITATTLSLKGASGDGNSLSLAGTGTTHKFISTGLSATYLSIDSNIQLANYSTAISDCVPAEGTSNADYGAVINNGWLIKAKNTFEYTWTGSSGTAWDNGANWDTLFVPGTDCKIIIPAATNKPVLPDTECYGGTLTIASGASIKLGTTNLVLSGNEGSSAGTILTNNGSIIYTGEGRITDNSASPSPINDNIHGTVEYAAGGTPGTVTDFYSDANTDDYNNLLISGTGWRLANTLKMQTITIANGTTCSVNSATTLRAQTFTFNASGDNKNISATADLTLLPYVAANDLTVPSGIGSKFTISSAGKLYLANASTNSIIFSASDTFEYELNFSAPVTLNQDITVHNSVTANANISGTGELIFAGTGDINFYAGTYVHSRITVNKDAGAGSLTINGNCTLSNLNITSGKTITFTGTPAITNYADTATGGNLIFTNGATFTNAFTRNSGGATQITGTINAASVTLKAATISGSAGITTSGTQTFNGTINGAGTTDNLTLNSESGNITFVGIVGGTTPLASLSITGPSIINCAGITTTGLQSYNGTIQIVSDTTLKSNTEIDFTNTISGSQKLTVNTPIFKSAANTDNSISLSEIEFAATSTEIQTNSKKLTFDLSTVSGTGKTIALSSGSELILKAGISLAPAVANSGTITCNGAATFKGAYSGSAASLTLSNGTTIFESDLDLSDTTFSHTGGSGTVQIGGTSTEVVTITGPQSPQSFSNFETNRSLKILGSNTFNNFTATGLGGKSISFEAGKTQTVNGTLSLSGTSGSLLKLQNEGTGVWTITCSNPTISYVDVINSTSTNSIFADNSNDRGNNTNWNFLGLTYNWIGGNGTTGHENDWNVKTNWDRASVPGHGTIVKIASGKTAKLVDDVDISITPADTSSIEINGTLDLSTWSLTAGTITNNGTVQLAGKSTQTISGSISSSDTSVVEYNDTNVTFEKFAWDEDSDDTNGKQYKNLTISKPITGNTDALYVAKNLITKNAIEAGSLEVTGTATINGSSVTTTGAQTYGGAVTSTGAITLQAFVINLNGGTVTTTGAQTYKSPVASTGSITLEGSAINLNGTSVTTVGTQTYKSPVTIETSTELSSDTGNLSFNSTVDGGSLKIIKAGSTTFTGVVNISALTEDDAHAGTITFSNGGTISSAVEFKTPAAVSISGTMNIGASAPWAAFTHTAGNTLITGTLNAAATQLANTTINGTLNAASVNLSNLTVAGNSTIATTGTQQFTGTIDDSTADTHTLTLNSDTSQITLAGNVGQTKALKEITVTGPVKINCASVKTKDAQTYNSSVTSDGSITLESAAINLNTTSVNTIGSQTYKGAVILQVNGNITLIAKNALDEYQTVQFDQNVSCAAAVTPNLILDANTNINCASVTTTGSQSFSGRVALYQSPQLEATQITFGSNITESAAGKTLKIKAPKLISSIAVSTEAEIALGTLELLQDVEISSTNAAALKLTVGSITGSSQTLTFAGSTSLFTLKDGIIVEPEVINNKSITCAGAATFKGIYSGTGATLNLSAATTTFKNNLDLSGTTLNASTGTLQFNGDGTTQTLTTKADGSTHFYKIAVATPAKVSTTSNFYVDGTTWTNSTATDGFIATTPSQITFANSSITIGGKNTFNKIIFPTASQTVSVMDSNNIRDLTSTGASQNITFTSSNIFNTVSVAGAGTNLNAQNEQNEFNDTITIGSASVAAGTISLKAQTTLNFAANFNCNSVTLDAAANAVTFNGNAAYNTSFVNNGTAATTFLASFTGSGNATFVSDAILQGTAGSAYNLSCPAANLIKCKNFVLYSGNYTFGGNLETTGDVIILGSEYVVDDSETGIANVFAYNQTRLSAPQFSGTFPAASSLSGTITANANTSIKVGKNFYANGTSLQGNSDWYIQLPKICDASHGFAEAIKTSAKNCKVSCWETPSNTATDDNADAKIAAYSCTDNSGNANWDFADFTIAGAYTVRDNAICITFSDPVRNLNNEINGSGGTIQYLKYQNATGATSSFEGFYSKPDCQNENKILGADLPKIVYIKAPSTWNTDANGKSPGEEGSTDRNGNHKTAIPYLDIPRSLTATAAGTTDNVNYIITNKWGKRLNNYSTRTPTSSHAYGDSGDSNDVLDKTGPVLYSVRTGQELHSAYDPAVGAASEHSYDSHNFIEFLYSEKVDFAGSSDDTALNNVDASTDTFVENIQVTDDLGAIKDSITVEGSLSFAGLGTIQNGLIHTGSSGSTDKYVNALYRTGANAEYSVRLSIAGYTDPLNTVTDPDGNTYKKWIGYIEEAVQPTGNVIYLVNASNENICVKDKEGNVQIKYENDSSNKIPIVNENGQTSPVFTSCYGDWDISEPIFAIIRQNIRTLWAAGTFAPDYQAEAIGNNSGVGSTLDRIEFHLYDNSPKFTSGSPEWFTEVGWCNPGSSGLKSELYLANDSYAADIFGGARAFDSTERTSGGIRYSTIVNSAGAFKYGVAGALPSSLFDTTKPVYPGATSLIFTGASNPRRAASDLEGLYFALPLPDSVSFDVKTSFTVSYNENQAYITDLAGNRLRSKTVSTVDRTPPSIDMTISPIGADEIEIVFVKTLVTDSSLIHYITDHVSLQDEPITEQFEYLIGKCFDIITIDSSGAPAVVDSSDLKIDTSSPAKVWVTTNSNNSGFTHIKLKLNRAITLQDIQEKFIRVTFAPPYAEESVDLFTQKPGSRVTFIQDENGNTIQMYTAHALSDFAVGEVNPLYAYDSSMTLGDGSIISGGLWHTDTSDDVDPQSWAVHDWNRDQKNYGTLPAGHTLAIVADTVSAANVNVYLANKPDEKSISTQANKDFEFKTPWRIWLPDLMPGVFASLAEKNNTNFAHKSGELLSDKSNRFIFDLDSSITDLWKEGDQVSFLFGITKSDGSPVTIMHSPELDINVDKHYLTSSTKMPLFALRQTDPDDFLSLDLWSFRLKNLVSQKGGVTILNNVIDSTAGEKVVLRVDLPEAANLTVLVMTLDGNIVDYLQRGQTSAGEHYYSWNGSNRNGKAVARGMYFIRVMSKGIDETRKVMVVKE